ncbi:GNAT family N-acetyltransferase [Sedimentibacter sp. zth1]|uniref:GNAT family N-acetyltransferase n=1 Tax=Sedimentibacter sp. zth1 TaxID=2816908 RepID=UPI001A9184F1|nr:GNAT family N-acetyltransferase [Sedimentibacter sp. zth1]QSX06457.1 GNAT family N-acetyltransferase [Sedimentibacter sp. zth1]
MIIAEANINDTELVAPLIAKFRVELKKLKQIDSDENLEVAKEGFMEYINSNYPIYIALDENVCVGYLVCRVDKPNVWVESIYVVESFRRKEVASLMFEQAEKLAHSYGEETLYNYVHPNNDKMLKFLAKHGYDVLNLIEIRKKYTDEKTNMKINVNNFEFDY